MLSYAGSESEANAKAEQHLEKANELRKIADHDGAIAEYEKVISLSPNSDIALNAKYWIGQSHFEAGQLDTALSAFEKLLDEHPSSAIAPSTKQMIERVQLAKKDKSLFEAVEKGDVERFKLLISMAADVNAKDQEGRILLLLAAREGHADIAAILIGKGAEINARHEAWGTTPLHTAAIHGHADVVKLLIDARDHGAHINARARYGHTPLQYATFQGHTDVVELLLARGADIETGDDWNCTPLHAAVRGNHPEIVKLLLDRGANVEARLKGQRRGGERPLHRAVRDNRIEVVKLLLKAGADVNSRGKGGGTPLHRAVQENGIEVAKLLLKEGAHVNMGYATPLHSAIGQGNQDMVELLLDHGARPRRLGNANLVGLAMITSKRREMVKHREMVKFLVDKGFEHSAAHVAAYFGDLAEVKSYLATGGDVNALDQSGMSLTSPPVAR
jgi:ankyrin repeat protein